MSGANYECRFCQKPITFKNRKALNLDGSAHRCRADADAAHPGSECDDVTHPATLFAMAAMNAIVNAQIQAGGIDHIHRMDVYDVADAAWRLAGAMVNGEKDFRRSMEFSQ